MNEAQVFEECYPEGVPTEFPVELFAPVPDFGDASMVLRDLELQDRIMDLEEYMLTLPQTELPLTHTFADGVYVRTIFMPKGTLVIGRIHLREHVNIIVSGDVTMVTVDGPIRLKAPQTFVSAVGTKKVLYINEDTTWISTHSLPPTEIEDILDILSVPSFREYRALLAQQDSLEEVTL